MARAETPLIGGKDPSGEIHPADPSTLPELYVTTYMLMLPLLGVDNASIERIQGEIADSVEDRVGTDLIPHIAGVVPDVASAAVAVLTTPLRNSGVK